VEEGLRGREVYERGGGTEEGFCNLKKKEVKEGKRIGLRRREGREGGRERGRDEALLTRVRSWSSGPVKDDGVKGKGRGR